MKKRLLTLLCVMVLLSALAVPAAAAEPVDMNQKGSLALTMTYRGKAVAGGRLTFTDMDWETVEFQVMAVEILSAHAIEEMTAGEYDLTLFACTYGSENRVTVRCDWLTE